MNKEDKQAILDCLLVTLHKTNDFDDLVGLEWKDETVIAIWEYPNKSRDYTAINTGFLSGASFISEVLKMVRYIR